MRGQMKFMKRAKVYQGANVSYNPETKTALSYNWWEFVKEIGGQVFFNSYHYSQSTSKHQSKVRSLLDTLGVNVDFFVHAPNGLQEPNNALEYMEKEVQKLHRDNQKGRPNSRAYSFRAEKMQELSAGITALKACINQRDKELTPA
jgi:hypothetical protein